MIRHLRALGLVLLALFTTGAAGASTAQATTGEFEWASGATQFRIKSDPTAPIQSLWITAGSLKFDCDEIVASGTLPGGTTATSLTTNELTYNHSAIGGDKCKGDGGLQPKLEINGCNYKFNAGETIQAGEITAAVDIVCPAGKEITTNAGFLCTVHVPAQNGLGHVILRTNATIPETVTGEQTIVGVKYTHTGLCGDSKAHTDGIISGKFTMTAENVTQRDITVT